jgi:putative membrane protein
MKKITLSALFLAGILSFSACNSTSKKEDSAEMAEDTNEKKFDDTKVEDDAEFAVAAADGGMVEVQLGELAQKNGASKGVKDFGSMMVKDHTKANDEMKALAVKKNITLPTTLSEKKQKMYNDLAEKKGAEFDKAYVSAMVDDHKEDIKAFEKEAQDGKDADLKAFAAEKLPTLNHHLETVQGLKETLK